MTIESDASNMGWGARQGELQTDRSLLQEEPSHHIRKISRTTSCLSSSTVLCQAQQQDSHTNKVGQCHGVDMHQKASGTHSQPFCQLALTIWDWCIWRNVFLIAENLPGKDNITADRELRSTKDHYDWMLNPQVFQQIQLLMGPLQTNLCESIAEFLQLETRSRSNCDGCVQPKTRGFANPPCYLIACCLNQIKETVWVVMITPLCGTQWFWKC